MKENLILTIAVLLLVAGLATGQQRKQTDSGAEATAKLQVTQCALKVNGMVCGGCAEIVKEGLLKVGGVKAAKVDYKSGDAQVEYDPNRTTPEKIVVAFNQANRGFRAELPKPKPRKG